MSPKPPSHEPPKIPKIEDSLVFGFFDYPEFITDLCWLLSAPLTKTIGGKRTVVGILTGNLDSQGLDAPRE